jgi:hypothetical protein
MMGDVHKEGEQDLASGETAVGRIVDPAELLLGHIGDDGGAIVEGAAEELDDRVFVLVAGGRRIGGSGFL